MVYLSAMLESQNLIVWSPLVVAYDSGELYWRRIIGLKPANLDFIVATAPEA